MSQIHLICNAHIDPVWQWEWEEGAAAAVSTFRAAADFCEEFGDFVFCHNEALLYRWIEEYEPSLFERIQHLVKAGKWHIMGGWYLQPDCNMPSGESIIRQMRLGRQYFTEKFGSVNTTAVNFDPFGHNRGLVQLMQKAGYDSYLIMRPSPEAMELPGDDFMWVGYDGSEIMAHRINTGYNSPLGGAREKAEKWLKAHPNTEIGLIPWGVGNHGGGPSRKDISDLNVLKAALPEKGMRHSTPEEYFAAIAPTMAGLPRVNTSLNPFAVGCYTSQIRIKQQHRLLEGQLALTERMLTHAGMAGLIKYPAADMLEAERDLCMSEFHDTLPGSSIQPVEETSLQGIAHGLEIANRLRARAFYALARGQKPAAPGEYPILVYNPFPYEIEQDVECEFMLADQNWKDEFTDMTVWRDDVQLPGQIEKERSNLPLDWRKRVVFRARLKPMQMNRFDCRPNILPSKPAPSCDEADGRFVFDNAHMHVEIGKATGLLESYKVDGKEYLTSGAMTLLVIKDNVDPWGMTVDRFRDVIGEFALMDEKDSARFAGVDADALAPVRVVEDGPVRTVIEASFRYGDSCAIITYRLSRFASSVDMDVRLQFMEKNRMVKLSIPSICNEKYIGQGMFGSGELHADGREDVAQQWVASVGDGSALTVINNGTYGSDFENGEIRISLLRSAAYTGHPIFDRKIVPQDRFMPRIDQGERLYRFVLKGGCEDERLTNAAREAQQINEQPYALSFFPSKSEGEVTSAASLEGEGVQLTALRPALDGNGYIARLFDASGRGSKAKLKLPLCGVDCQFSLKPFEILTLRITSDGNVAESDILS